MDNGTKIFLTLFLTYAFFTNTYLTTNDASRFSLTAAIVEEHSLVIDSYLDTVISKWWFAKDYAVFDGRRYSDKAPLGSFLGVPVYFVVRLFTSDLGILTYFVSLFTAGLATAATALLIYRFGAEFTENHSVRTGLALAYGIASMPLFYGTVFFSHAFTALFGFTSFYLLFLYRIRGGEKKLVFAGVSSALAVASDYYSGIIAIVLFFYATATCRKKTYLFLLPFLGGILPLLLYHWAAFESPFAVPYLYSNLYFKFHSAGFYGVGLLDWKKFSNLLSQLFSVWGFFFTTPFALLSFAALPRFSKTYRIEALAILSITSGLFYFTAVLGFFDAYSTRHLVLLVPFLFLPLFTLDFEKPSMKKLFALLFIFGMVINLAGTDIFLPGLFHNGVCYLRAGNHNLFGQFLRDQGINIPFLSFLPLFVFYGLIWRQEILKWTKPVSS
ncbi:MAG TPA: hypothetical protein ENH13_03320 [Euryarchaeota archaeon]|nr:hypothetical protein [Euryarchaeota archaeon]